MKHECLKKENDGDIFYELTAISDEKQFDAFIEMFNSVCCHDPVEKCLKLLNPKIDDESRMMSSFFENSRNLSIVHSFRRYLFSSSALGP